MWPYVPPDFLGVVDALRLDQSGDHVLEFAVGSEDVRDTGAGEILENLAAVTFPASVLAEPEWRVHGQREDVRQKIADHVHDLNARFKIFDGHVHVQAEDEIGAGHHLQIVNDLLVSGIGSDRHVAPVREGMRSR